MTEQQTLVRIPKLAPIDKLTLEEELDQDAVRFQEPTVKGDAHGELLTTTAIVVVTVAALKSLTTWLLKTSRRGMIIKEMEVVYPDGRVEKATIKVDISSSETPEADVLKVLTDLFKIDPATFTK